MDKDLLLDNMDSVMAENGLLIIYDFWISYKMAGNDAYTKWYHDLYLANFPKPPRKEDIWQQKDLTDNFLIKNQVTYEMAHEFDMDSFIRFMMIQSNVNAKIEGGHETEEEIHGWMSDTLKPIFDNKQRTLIFEGYNWYIEHK